MANRDKVKAILADNFKGFGNGLNDLDDQDIEYAVKELEEAGLITNGIIVTRPDLDPLIKVVTNIYPYYETDFQEAIGTWFHNLKKDSNG